MNTTQYTIVRESDVHDLIDKVNAKIAEGWQPLGGVSVTLVPGSIFAQAMVKEG